VVATWFATGFSKHAAAGDAIVASGTGPSELQTGRMAVKLAAGADSLHPKPSAIDATVLGPDHAIAFVHAKLVLPLGKSASGYPLTLAAVLVRDGAGWAWVSLQFAWADVGAGS
jgi:hypothetical protein